MTSAALTPAATPRGVQQHIEHLLDSSLALTELRVWEGCDHPSP